ncbi:MAG: hypothetical protein LBV26_08005 [Bacteroidales bacterium]|nr:hypothetical protein [Bacteroidales bacterium]
MFISTLLFWHFDCLAGIKLFHNMDREIPRQIKIARQRKNIIRLVAGLGAIVAAVVLTDIWMSETVSVKNLTIGKVDRGTIEIMVNAGEPLLKLDLTSVETEYLRKLDEQAMWQSKLVQVRIDFENSLSELEMQQQIQSMKLDQLYTDLQGERYLDSLGVSAPGRIELR